VPDSRELKGLGQGCEVEYGLGYKIEFLWCQKRVAVYFFSTVMAQDCAIRVRARWMVCGLAYRTVLLMRNSGWNAGMN